MGFRFRRSINLGIGRLNLTKRGISSISTGVPALRVNIGKRGTRTTVGIPGSGVSYSTSTNARTTRNTGRNRRLAPPRAGLVAQLTSIVHFAIVCLMFFIAIVVVVELLSR